MPSRRSQPPHSWTAHLQSAERTVPRAYRRQLKRCLKGPKRSPVHDLRVESRRLIAWLNLCRAMGFAKAVRPARRRVRRLLRELAELRDVQVQLELVSNAPAAVRRPSRELRWGLQRRERKLSARICRRCRDVPGDAVTRSVRRGLRRLGTLGMDRDFGDGPPADVLGWIVTLGAVAEQARRKARASRPETLHALRLALKKLRYGLETVSPALPASLLGSLDQLRHWQSLLGEVHDLDVFLLTLDETVVSHPERAEHTKAIRGWLTRRREARLRRLAARWASLGPLLAAATRVCRRDPRTRRGIIAGGGADH